MQQARFTPATLPETVTGTNHRDIPFHCNSCSTRLCVGGEIIRMGGDSFYVDFRGKERVFIIFGKPRQNVYKNIETRSISCKRCRAYVGHWYPHQPEDPESGPCCKLFYIDKKRGTYSMHVGWSESRYETWLSSISKMEGPLESMSRIADSLAAIVDIPMEHRAQASQAYQNRLNAGDAKTVATAALHLDADELISEELTPRHAPALGEILLPSPGAQHIREFLSRFLASKYQTTCTWNDSSVTLHGNALNHTLSFDLPLSLLLIHVLRSAKASHLHPSILATQLECSCA